jgi:cytochrome c-type biogenesis protein CcmH
LSALRHKKKFHLKDAMKKKIWLSLIAALVLGLIVIAEAAAQDQQPTPPGITDDQVNAIARQMYCPVCENTPLDVCPTQACAEWRELIRDELAQEWSEKQIKDYFVQRFGARVLATPPATGLNWLVYVVPPIIFLAGAYVLYRALLGFRKPATQPAPEAELQPANDDSYIERIEEELRKR